MGGQTKFQGVFLLAGVALSSSCHEQEPEPLTAPDAGSDDASAADASVLGDASRDAAAPFRDLFDGTGFTGWHRYLGIPVGESAPLGIDNDPRGVFTVENLDGEPAIHVSGEVWGALISEEELANFELRLEYKWGSRLWPPLSAFDSGVMVLSTGPLGAVNAGGDALSDPIGSGAFMVSIEYQLATGDIGGLYNLGPIAMQRGLRTVVPEITSAWNEVAIVVRGASSQHFLNGQLVASASSYELRWPEQATISLDRGKIQLQSEGAEIYFRHVRVRALENLAP